MMHIGSRHRITRYGTHTGSAKSYTQRALFLLRTRLGIDALRMLADWWSFHDHCGLSLCVMFA